ncbi:MAG: adenine nucleotide alpha hydrolase [Spirochaetia bacterium]|nr:adenine nucleotide alpha hydrolase [Spirochaetia bacterium]
MKHTHYRELIKGNIPPRMMRFIKNVGKTINTYEMITSGERVLLSVSGGKDSLALAAALSLRLKWLPVEYYLEAVMIDWNEHPIGKEAEENLITFFSDLSIPFTIFHENQFSEGFDGDFNCYLCSRNRRRILFTYADANNFSLIATGHHLDDLVETSLMNLTKRGSFATMLPIQEFFKGKLHVIRPMIEIHEDTIRDLTGEFLFPVMKPVCPYDQSNIRSKIKPIVRELVALDRDAREHIFHAHEFAYRIKREYNSNK